MRVRLCDAGAVEPLLDIIGTAGPAVSREALLSLGSLVAPVEAIKVPPPRTKWTRFVPHPVLIGHAASLTPY